MSRKNSYVPLKFLGGVFIVWLCLNLLRTIMAQPRLSAQVVLVIFGSVALFCALMVLISRQQYYTWRQRYAILHAEHSRLQGELTQIHGDSKQQITKLRRTLAERNALIEQLEQRVALFDAEVERITEQKLRDLLAADYDDLEGMASAFLELKAQFSACLRQATERLTCSEQVFKDLQRLLQAQRKMLVGIEADGQNSLKLTVSLPADPQEFFGIDALSDLKELQGKRRHLIKLFHPDQSFVLKLEWVTQLFTKMTKVVNTNYDKLNQG